MRHFLPLSALLSLLAMSSTAAYSGQPENPGCSGQFRAVYLNSPHIGNNHGETADGQTDEAQDDQYPGASRWGSMASEQSTQGSHPTYTIECGGNPTDSSGPSAVTHGPSAVTDDAPR